MSRYVDLIKVPQFSIFLTGRIISGFGDILFTMATMWYVLSKTNSPLATSVVPLVPSLTYLVLSLPASTLVDKLPKKPILIAAELFRGLVVLVTAWLMSASRITPLQIYIANFLLSLVGELFNPAQQAVLPTILPDPSKQLVQANGLLSSGSQLTKLTGYGLGGVIVAWLHPYFAAMGDGISFIISALMFVPIYIPSMTLGGRLRLGGFVRDSLDGIKFVLAKPILRTLTLFSAIVNLSLASLGIFSATFAKTVLHSGVVGYGWLEAAFAIGGILGALMAARFISHIKARLLVCLSYLLAGSAMVINSLVGNQAVSIILFTVIAASISMLNIPLATSIQLLAPDNMRARVTSSFWLMVGGIPAPTGLLVFGWLMNMVGPRQLFEYIGYFLLAAGFSSLFLRSFRSDTTFDELFL